MTSLNINQRENLKKKIEADLELLRDESWSKEVSDKLEVILKHLREVNLEGYDD